MSWVIEHSPHKGSELLCLLMLANRADEEGGAAWPSFQRLAKDCRLTRRQIINLMHRLETSGAISVQRRPGPGGTNLTNMVRIVMAEEGEKSSPPSEKISPGDSEAHFTRVVKPASPKPSVEPSLLLTPVAQAVDGIFGAFTERGYGTDARFLSVLVKTYPDLNLELEALKIAEWLTEPRHRTRQCSKKFIDNWLKKAEADRISREQLTLTALGPTAAPVSKGATVNSTYYPPAAFQRNDNPDAALPQWDAEQARRSDAERERIKQQLRSLKKHTA